jgi:uncharacterized 2Fe-2S/4Fe-4S cluster protein (DUF4445 family)
MDVKTCNIELLPHGRIIQATEGERLLESLMAHNIFLRADCGGRGVCGKCRVKIVDRNGTPTHVDSCSFPITGDLTLEIPESSLLSTHIIDKAPVALPASFTSQGVESSAMTSLGIAVDLGTTTIAVYLCDIEGRKVLSSIAVKNPQALYGDDVMNRIGEIGRDAGNLVRLQQLVVHAIEWGIKELLGHFDASLDELLKMVVVGNPTMIHILLGVSPSSIGLAPYQPAFFKARQTSSSEIGLDFPEMTVHTLDQISGFIGGDILSAALATELENEPVGTLLIDLGTNGELLLKGKDTFFATSCATGPAFEGASLSCGMQAIPGAIDRVVIGDLESVPQYSVVKNKSGTSVKPSGLCGSGVISAMAALVRTGIVTSSGRFIDTRPLDSLQKTDKGNRYYVIVPAGQTAIKKEIGISQQDIRSVQLGKAALITGIEYLLRTAGMVVPEKIIIAGAFGSHLEKEDMLTLGMLPDIDPSNIHVAGNAAGAGAIMVLCDERYNREIGDLASKISVIELAARVDFQNTFVEQLGFPKTLKEL